MWISQENENGQRKTSDQAPPQAGPQAAHRLKKTFPKSARILKKKDYYSISKSGSRLLGNFIVVDYRLGNVKSPRLGITVSKKYGTAVVRNRFKRVVREAYRYYYSDIPDSLEMNISPRKFFSDISKEIVLSELRQLFSKTFL